MHRMPHPTHERVPANDFRARLREHLARHTTHCRLGVVGGLSLAVFATCIENGNAQSHSVDPDTTGGSLSASLGGSLVWELDLAPGQTQPRWVSLGNHGSSVLLLREGLGATIELLPVFTSSPPTAAWVSAPIHQVHASRIASADHADVHLTLTWEQSSASAPRLLVLRRFSSASPQPVWESVLPNLSDVYTSFGVDVSAEGGRIAAWVFDATTGYTDVHRVDASNGQTTGTVTIDLAHPPTEGSLTDDGSRLYLTAPHWDSLLDLEAGQIDAQFLVGATVGSAQDIADAAPVFASARNDGKIAVYHTNPVGNVVPWFQHPSPGPTAQYSALALSADGGTLVCASSTWSQPGSTSVEILDLTQPGHPTIYEHVFAGAPAGGSVTDLAIADDGSAVYGTTSGDVAGALPEVFVLTRDAQLGWQIEEHDLDAPAWGLDAHPALDRFCVLARGFGSAPTYPPIATVALFDLGGIDLSIAPPATAGGAPTIVMTSEPGAPCLLLAAPGVALPPHLLPDGSELFLPPGSNHVAGSAIAGPDGVATFPLPSGLASGTWFFQGARSDIRFLTRDYAGLTVP